MLFWTQGQYIFIHDVIKHRLETLGFGTRQSSTDDDDDDDDGAGVYASTFSYCSFCFSK